MIEAKLKTVVPSLTEALVEVEPMFVMVMSWDVRLTKIFLVMESTKFKRL